MVTYDIYASFVDIGNFERVKSYNKSTHSNYHELIGQLELCSDAVQVAIKLVRLRRNEGKEVQKDKLSPGANGEASHRIHCQSMLPPWECYTH